MLLLDKVVGVEICWRDDVYENAFKRRDVLSLEDKRGAYRELINSRIESLARAVAELGGGVVGRQRTRLFRSFGDVAGA